MKKSKRIILILGCLIFIAVITLAVYFRIFNMTIAKNPTACTATCNKEISSTTNGNSKSIVTPDVPVVNINGLFDVTINPGKQMSASITADKNILPYLNLSVLQNQLNIGAQANTNNVITDMTKTVVTAPTLQNINLTGNNILHANINSDFLRLKLNGENQADLQGDIKNLQIILGGQSSLQVNVSNNANIILNITGDGTVNLSGATKNLTIISGGKATVIAKDLTADNVNILGAGESDLTVNATQTLVIKTAGKSTIKYYGNPKISKASFGNTTITQIS